MPEYNPAIRTRSLARIVGPYLLVMAATLFTRGDTLPAFLSGFMQDEPLVLVSGAFTLMAGLAIIASHHHWTTPSAVTITLIGIVGALKGASLMAAPGLGAEMTATVVAMPAVLLAAIGVELFVGIWLSYVGWLLPVRAAAQPAN